MIMTALVHSYLKHKTEEQVNLSLFCSYHQDTLTQWILVKIHFDL